MALRKLNHILSFLKTTLGAAIIVLLVPVTSETFSRYMYCLDACFWYVLALKLKNLTGVC